MVKLRRCWLGDRRSASEYDGCGVGLDRHLKRPALRHSFSVQPQAHRPLEAELGLLDSPQHNRRMRYVGSRPKPSASQQSLREAQCRGAVAASVHNVQPAVVGVRRRRQPPATGAICVHGCDDRAAPPRVPSNDVGTRPQRRSVGLHANQVDRNRLGVLGLQASDAAPRCPHDSPQVASAQSNRLG